MKELVVLNTNLVSRSANQVVSRIYDDTISNMSPPPPGPPPPPELTGAEVAYLNLSPEEKEKEDMKREKVRKINEGKSNLIEEMKRKVLERQTKKNKTSEEIEAELKKRKEENKLNQ